MTVFPRADGLPKSLTCGVPDRMKSHYQVTWGRIMRARPPALALVALIFVGCNMQEADRCTALGYGPFSGGSRCISALKDSQIQALMNSAGDAACLKAQKQIPPGENGELALDECQKARDEAQIAALRDIMSGAMPTQTSQSAPAAPEVSEPVVEPVSPTETPPSGNKRTAVPMLPTDSADSSAPDVIPAGQWAIVSSSGFIGGKHDSSGQPGAAGFDSLQECERVRAGAEEAALKDAAENLSEGEEWTDMDDINYDSWQDLKRAGCAQSDGSAQFRVRNIGR